MEGKSVNPNRFRYHFDNVSREWLECGGISLLQYGELWCNPKSSMQEHLQWCYEVTLVIGGKGCITAGSQTYEVKENDCIISLPNEIHSYLSSSEDPMRIVFLGFNPGKKDTSFQYLFDELERLFRSSEDRLFSVANQYPLMVQIFSELQSNQPYSREVAGYLIAEFLIQCIRAVSHHPAKELYSSSNDDAALAYSLKNYIAKNIPDITGLRCLEPVFYYNCNYLSKKFFEQTGQHLVDYWRDCKMKEANRMLQSGMSVTEVSEKLNYSSIHSFSRSYKKRFGITPSESVAKKEKKD